MGVRRAGRGEEKKGGEGSGLAVTFVTLVTLILF